METYPGMERRIQRRARMNCTIIYILNEPVSARFIMDGEDIEAKMLDVSHGGLAMITDHDIPISTRLSMRFTLFKVNRDVMNFSGPVEVTGEVRSNIPLESNAHRLGINFTKVRQIEV